MEGQSVTAPHTFPLPIVGPLHKLYPFRKTHPPWAAVRIPLLHCGPPWVAVSPPRGQPASPRSLLVNHPPTRTQHREPAGGTTGTQQREGDIMSCASD